jgi:hypothetical protein
VRITSTITWPDMRGSKPVAASSLVAINNAYAKGSLAVKIVDRNGTNGISGVPVSLDAPVSSSKTTNDSGCVVFDGLNTGTYFGQFSKTGYVDMTGTNVVRPTNGFSVTTGSTGVSTFVYDRAATAAFKFVTRVNGTDLDSSFGRGLLLKNAQMPPNGERREIFTGNQSTWSYTNLFPFDSGYTAFPVACAADAPTGGGTILTSPPGGAAVMNKVGDPGHNQSPVKVWLPSINQRVTLNGSTTNSANLRIRVRPASGACGRTQNWITAADGWPPADATRGFTPGQYVVCADTLNVGGTTKRVEQTVNTTSGVDQTPTTINLDNSGGGQSPNGTCP